LVEALYSAAAKTGVEVWYGARAKSLVTTSGKVSGVTVQAGGRSFQVNAGAVILACGGFEANSEMRTRYLGPGWDVARVRGTHLNTGDGIRMALEVDAMPWGNWSGSHAVFWDQNSPPFGDLGVGDGFSKLSYPLGII